MKDICDKATADELIERINQIDKHSKPLWGKMNASQMLRHLILWEEMAQRKTLYKQSLMGKLFGKMGLKDMMKDEPAKRNLPSVRGFIPHPDGNIASEKQQLTDLLKVHGANAGEGFMHPFFGYLTAQQGGQMAYKHADHHLRQFGV